MSPFRIGGGWTVLAWVALLAAAGCENAVGDQVCTPDSVPTDEDDACPYGPPGGPKVTEQGDCDIPQTSNTASCDTDWVNDIYPLLTTEAASQPSNCATANCHGLAPGGVGGLFLGPDATAAYNVLKAYSGTPNYPYINTQDPEHSWILCNLKAQVGGGVPMPPAGMDPGQLAEVEKWAACGMPLEIP